MISIRPLAASLLLLCVCSACADSDRRASSPASPSAVTLPSASSGEVRSVSWECARAMTLAEGWDFGSSTCVTSRQTSASAAAAAITIAPTNLRSTVTGNTVRLDWGAVADDVRSYLIEAGSAPGASNLASFNTANNAPALIVNDVPAGMYFVRVRALGLDGLPGPASNEIAVAVSAACGAPPGPPTALTFTVTGAAVSLSWNRPSGAAPGAYVVEAGSAPGLSNIVVFDTGSAITQLTATAPSGTYYVRVRARNACGIGTPSNEVTIGVGTTPTPPTPPPPGPTPPRVPPVAPPPVSPVEPVVPGTPPIEQVIPVAPVVTTPAGPAQVQIVSGGRPNAGAGPIVNVTVDPTIPLLPRLHITSPSPFNRAVITIDLPPVPDTRFGAMLVTEAYYDVRLPQPQTTMDVTLTAATARSFTIQVAVSADGGATYGSYASAPVGTSGAAQFFTDRAAFLASTTGAAQVIDFEGIAAPGAFVQFASVPGGLAVGGVRFTADLPSRLFAVVNPDAGLRSSYDMGSGAVLTAQPSGTVVRITLPAAASALGFDTTNATRSANPGTLQLTLASGQQFSVNLRGNPQIQFAGIVSRAPIGFVDILVNSNAANFDNVVVTSSR